MEHGRSNIFHSSGGEVLEIGPQGISLLGKGITGWFAAEVSENFEGLITWTADPAI